MGSPEPGLEDQLVNNVNDAEERQQNVRIHKRARIERRKGGPPLDERQEDVGE